MQHLRPVILLHCLICWYQQGVIIHHVAKWMSCQKAVVEITAYDTLLLQFPIL